MNDIYKAFHEFFEIVDVDSAELREEVYRLRYKVYCLENNFEDLANFPDEMEKDEYDHHSSHILLRHRTSDTFVGTARLILQDPSNLNKPLPIECHTQIDPRLISEIHMQRRHTAEISRFSILGQFFGRRTKFCNTDSLLSNKNKSVLERRRFPNICLALAVGVVYMCTKHNIHYWLSVMDPLLNRLLRYYGLGLNPIGPITNYHGMRRPHYIKFKHLLDNLFLNHREIWELVTDYGNTCPYPVPQAQVARTSDEKLNDLSIIE